MFELDGQTAIVTRAATGIGEVIAKRHGSMGARVVIADINDKAAAEAAERIGENALAVQLDVTDPASVQQAISSVLTRTQSIEIIVNNAGLAGKAAPIWEQTDEDWSRVMAINV